MLLFETKNEQTNSFPLAGFDDLSLRKNPPRPFSPILLVGISFEDEAHVLVIRQSCTGFDGIVGAIQTHKDLAGSQVAGFCQHPLQKRDEFALTVLLALSQLQFQTPVLGTQVGPCGSVAVLPVVGACSVEFLKRAEVDNGAKTRDAASSRRCLKV